MGQTRLDLARKEIVAFLEDSGRTVFSLKDLGEICRDNGDTWRLASHTNRSSFTEYLCQKKILKKTVLKFSEKTHIVRYVLPGQFNKVELFLSVVADSYLSHYTAMAYHQLTEQIPKTYYVNHELTPKNIQANPLTQERIDAAFAKEARVSHSIATYKGDRIILLHSKNTNELGIIRELWDDKPIRITNIERTLIDCAVKPEYSGGVYEVAKAFRRAKSLASTNKINAMLKKLAYVYPYHQVLGFYLEQAGYDSTIVKYLSEIPMRYKFYLTRGMMDVDFSEKWRLYYPKAFS